MSRDNRLKVVLFALTGFGNTVLASLLEDDRVDVAAVFTVKYDQPFPYYAEQQLAELCRQRQVSCYLDVKVNSDEGLELVRKHAPDLIIVATFKQILKEKVLSLPKLGVVNVHPSLLPNYRGPCPTNAALLNGENTTGVTIHYVTETVDEGNLLLQRSIAIGESENDGQLRLRLSRLAGEMMPELIEMFAGTSWPAGTPQDHSRANFAPRPTAEDGYLEQATDVLAIQRKMRAFNPLPGTSILIGDRRVAVDRFEILSRNGVDGIYENGNAIDFIIGSHAIRLYKKSEHKSRQRISV